MLERIFRVLVGFVLACLAAAFTKVLFAIPPTEIMSLPPDVQSDRIGQVVESGLFSALHSMVFSSPFALVAAAIGEWRRLRAWTYYAVAGLGIAMIGFLTQHSAELTGEPTIVNNYGLTAFITSGFIAGLAYWLFAGRNAGGPLAATAPLAVRNDDRPTVAVRPSATTTGGGNKPKTGGAMPATGKK